MEIGWKSYNNKLQNIVMKDLLNHDENSQYDNKQISSRQHPLFSHSASEPASDIWNISGWSKLSGHTETRHVWGK